MASTPSSPSSDFVNTIPVTDASSVLRLYRSRSRFTTFAGLRSPSSPIPPFSFRTLMSIMRTNGSSLVNAVISSAGGDTLTGDDHPTEDKASVASAIVVSSNRRRRGAGALDVVVDVVVDVISDSSSELLVIYNVRHLCPLAMSRWLPTDAVATTAMGRMDDDDDDFFIAAKAWQHRAASTMARAATSSSRRSGGAAAVMVIVFFFLTLDPLARAVAMAYA